ncbi:MBL fold metallo-hydrolase [Roseivirga seohaensis]|uniref:MBL fold metallo-hydrolase n=1 Tax=Roseivirga seohaensis TaxID=1914963 RepID=A0A150XZT9_9BACT|nr:MBL fold metallo-hydrolase [Roseivirga seohaensis]KYG84174.1 MBL fold metallo-hydrolase [Roseivirga seohaensis]
MNRRNFVKQTSLITGIGATTGFSFLSALFDQGGYKMNPLRNNVGFFTEKGGTIGWMASNNGIVVVDTQYQDSAAHLIEELKKKTNRQIDLLINTHHHGDHTSGNIAFKGLVKEFVAHENSKSNLARTSRNPENTLLPNTTYKSGKWSKKVGDETMALHYFGAGHTDGDSVVHFENANIVHMGDLLFNRRPPFIDKSAGANMANWQVVLEKTYNTFDNDTIFVYGHAGDGYNVQGKREDLKAFSNYLAKSLEYVKKGIDAGKTKEALSDVNEIPGAPEWKGNQSRTIDAAYIELFEGK